jgi:hypothetical protein
VVIVQVSAVMPVLNVQLFPEAGKMLAPVGVKPNGIASLTTIFEARDEDAGAAQALATVIVHVKGFGPGGLPG